MEPSFPSRDNQGRFPNPHPHSHKRQASGHETGYWIQNKKRMAVCACRCPLERGCITQKTGRRAHGGVLGRGQNASLHQTDGRAPKSPSANGRVFFPPSPSRRLGPPKFRRQTAANPLTGGPSLLLPICPPGTGRTNRSNGKPLYVDSLAQAIANGPNSNPPAKYMYLTLPLEFERGGSASCSKRSRQSG